jgi:diguanylate cyclase (GGDEF)-like protein
MLLGALLPWYALMGGFISRLRQKLQDANKSLAKALEMINALAIRDDLTQAYNRRYLMEFLHQQKNAADRGSKTFAINLLDLDFFKQINDTYGHAAGDLVLKQFASMLKNQLRGADIIARYGGEEFVLVLTGSDLSNAVETAERLRRNTSELVFPGLEGKIKLTISVGVTQYVVSESVEALLSRADNALYQSKREGRDRVTVFQGHNSAKLPA